MTKKLIKYLEYLGAFMISALFITIIIQVVAREILSIPTTWTVEVGRALFLAVVFLITPVVLAQQGLMTINSLYDLTKGKGHVILSLVNDLFVNMILIALALGSYERTIDTWAIEIPTVEWMKSGYLYLIMFIGTLLMLFFSINNTVKRLRKGR